MSLNYPIIRIFLFLSVSFFQVLFFHFFHAFLAACSISRFRNGVSLQSMFSHCFYVYIIYFLYSLQCLDHMPVLEWNQLQCLLCSVSVINIQLEPNERKLTG